MDICCTCIFQNNCALRRKNPGPIWDCSEFVVDTSEKASEPTLDDLRNELKSRRHESKGLCQNCELLETCSWYHKEAVIFHCEHYQ